MQDIDKNTVLNINLKSIKNNYKKIKKKVNSNCIVAATVKANAYGLGIKKIVPKLYRSGCRYFFVATTNEALEVRKVNKSISIFILNGLVTSDLSIIHKYNLIPIINNLSELKRIEKYQVKIKKSLKIAIHFDTGMSRLGLDKNETKLILENKEKYINFSNVVLVMSHLACADTPSKKKNSYQLENFCKIIKYFPNTKHSLANSAGILLGKKYHFDMVRPGISLYGGNPLKDSKNIYDNVINLKAKIIQVRNISKNDTIGYGATFKAKKNMIIGTVPLGYADGFSRLFSNNFEGYIGHQKISIVGRVSMDLITFDVTNVKGISKNKNVYVDIIGNKNNINNICKRISTIPYEVLTKLGKRYNRTYTSY